MSRRVFKKVQSREALRRKIVFELFEIREMINGSFHHLKVRCGKQSCWCMKGEGEGHPHQRIKWKINGKPISRAVPKKDIDLIGKLNDRFREFKSLRQKLVKLEKEVKTFLDEYEIGLIRKAQKLRSYLAVEEGGSIKGAQKTSENLKKRKREIFPN